MNKKVLYAVPIVALSIGLISSLSRPTYDEGYSAGYEVGKEEATTEYNKQAETNYNIAYQDGYNKGYDSALSDDQAYQDGYNEGYEEGYNEGYNEALWEHDLIDNDVYYSVDDDAYYYVDDDTEYNKELTVYVSANGSKYHSYASCSNMKNPISMTESQAINKGYSACSKCW